MQSLESRLGDKIIGVRVDVIERIDTVTERSNAVRNRVTSAIVGVSGLTWMLQLFGTTLKHLLGLP
jgi:hypothetical protein